MWEKGRAIFIQEGIPTFDTPERAVRAFLNLYRYSKNIKILQEIPPNLPKRIEFDHEKARILLDQGIKKKEFSSHGNRVQGSAFSLRHLGKSCKTRCLGCTSGRKSSGNRLSRSYENLFPGYYSQIQCQWGVAQFKK